MRRILRALPLVLVVALFAFAVVGCGGDDSESASDTTTAIETAEDTATEESDVDLDDIASASNCRELGELGSKLTQVFTGTGGDFEDTQRFLDEFAGKAPEEIREDFAVFADAWAKFVDAIGDTGLSSGQTPSPEVAQKLRELQSEIDQTRLQEATTNISRWVQENCR